LALNLRGIKKWNLTDLLASNPIARVFPFMDVDDHSLAVDVGDLQLRGFGSPKTGSVEKQQDGSIANVGCGRDQLLDLFRAEHNGKLLRHSSQLHVL
jgi:hypothetical protein